MRRVWLGIAVTIALVMVVAGNSTVPAVAAQGDVKEITMSAKKFEFGPSEIRVKAGTRVRLTVTATDREHSIEINPFAEGADKKGTPGLKFDASVTKTDFKLPKDQAVQVEFTAVQAGTYAFKCDVVCGLGHKNMKGQIVVEP